MAVEFESINDQARWEKAIKNVAEILELKPENVKNYLLLVYDGTQELKADTDIPNVTDVVAMTMVFLEHITGQKVRLED
jgi:hypothetical protein